MLQLHLYVQNVRFTQAEQPPVDNLTLTTIEADMRIIVMDYQTQASLKYLQVDFMPDSNDWKSVAALKEGRSPSKTLHFIQMDSSHERCEHDSTWRHQVIVLNETSAPRGHNQNKGCCWLWLRVHLFYFFFFPTSSWLQLNQWHDSLLSIPRSKSCQSVCPESLSQSVNNACSLWIFLFLSPSLFTANKNSHPDSTILFSTFGTLWMHAYLVLYLSF